MKNCFLFSLLFICLITFVNAQTWRNAYDTPIVSISGGCVVDQNTFWLVGSMTFGSQSRLGMYKSTDGGMTWVAKYFLPSTNYSVSDICFVNPTTGFAGFNKGKILKTIDGGDNWTEINVDTVSTYTVAKLHFFDSNLGFALCTTGQSSSFIYKTTDGGTSWKSTATITGDYMYNMDFFSPTTGIATGGSASAMYYTSDGNTWNKGTVSGWPSGVVYSRTDQWGVKFSSANTAVSCGWGSIALGLQPTIFLKTTDGGANWVYQNQSDANRTNCNFYSVYFKDQMNGFAAGQYVYPGTVICKTTDGGITWIPLPSVAGFSPQIVMGINDKIIIAGGDGNIIISSDFGNSWTIANDHPISLMSSLKIVNNNIYACGYDGTFFKSVNSGSSFDMTYMPTGHSCLWSKGIYFLNENLGYAASQFGQILKTTNAGVTWTQVMKDTAVNGFNNVGVYFLNESVGFVVGNIGSGIDIIYKTTDGGQSWSNVQKLAFQNLNCVAFADNMHGAAGGNKSVILFTTDQGITWQVATVNTPDQLAINSIDFFDGLNGIAVGMGIMLKTTDGGATWSKLTVPSYMSSVTINGVCHDANGIYASGKIYVVKSTDQGNSWVSLVDSAFAVQNAITSMNSITTDKNGFLWVAHGKGIITNSPATGIGKDSFEPNSFSLEQNYPNPFNPSTNITFNINKGALVTLKVFDILGREIKLLYKGSMTAGKHIVNFNAGNLASGTYIYSLQANDQFTCRKMTLLK